MPCRDYDTEREATLLNVILRALKHKRPRVQYNDPTTLTEKTILRKRHRDAVEYLETYGLGVEQATDAEMAAVEDDFQRVVNILEA